jgi:hypothetical protein
MSKTYYFSLHSTFTISFEVDDIGHCRGGDDMVAHASVSEVDDDDDLDESPTQAAGGWFAE